jgi:hypothetical protein
MKCHFEETKKQSKLLAKFFAKWYTEATQYELHIEQLWTVEC